jgi:hypothetical protein
MILLTEIGRLLAWLAASLTSTTLLLWLLWWILWGSWPADTKGEKP